MTVLEELCAEFTRAERECFDAWCAVIGGRRAPRPQDVTESQAPLREAVVRLRERCQADLAAAETARLALVTRQAEGEAAVRDAVRAYRTGAGRARARQDWSAARWAIICQRDALTCGLGWPHRGEPVLVCAPGGKAGERGAGEGGIYLNSADVFNVMHVIWVPARGAPRRQGTVRADWLPNGQDGRLGPADPAGDIEMRLAEMPGQRLPAPLEQWPGHLAGAETAVPADAQPALFSIGDMARAPRLDGRAARRRSPGAGGGEGEWEATLF